MMKDSITLFHASAGAGKTYQLSLNYLFLLKQFCQSNPEALKKILAITYTNKAAYEMKERIISFLKEIALQTDRGKVLSEKTGIDPSYAEFLLENLFLYYDYFEVRTIDSFLFKLFRGLAYELNLSPDFTISNYLDEGHIEKALLKVFEKTKEDENLYQFFENFLNFLIKNEKALTLNFKKKIIYELKKIVEISTYREELLSFKDQNLQLPDPAEDTDKTLLRGILYYKFLTLLKEELEEVLFQEKTLYMGIWKEKLAKALKEEFLPWVYLKLGELKAFIIDELQDTDKLQWLSVYPLVENLVSEGNFFIAAGDTKQTIYRWKGGDPQLVHLIKENFKEFGLKEIPLRNNYRSCYRIVEFNNHLFTLLKEETELKRELLKRIVLGKNPKEEAEDLVEIALEEFDEIFSEIEQSGLYNLNGKVIIEWLQFDEKISQKEIKPFLFQRIEGILEELKASSLFEDTAILFRENEDVAEASSYLLAKGFPVIASSFLNLGESSLINTLISFLNLLFNPSDEVSLATVLLKFFEDEGIKLLKTYQIFKTQNKGNFSLYEYLKNYEPDFYKENILAPLEKAYLMNLYQFLRFLVSRFKLEEKFPEEKPYLSKFLTLALNFTAKGGEARDFLKFYPKLSEEELELSLEEAPLKILTIHASKGLEFRNVIVPLNFSLKSYVPQLQLLFSDKGVHRGKKEEFSEELLKIYYLEKIKHSLEIFNLLYVAFTRAKQNLYLLVPIGLKRNFLASEIFIRIFETLRSKKGHLWEKNYFQERILTLQNSI
ncbi:MAG: UvrD-helicase domain-containing protein [Caldimicrobium sp.]